MAFIRSIYRLGFEISPVILCGGIAAEIPGGMLPIVALTQSASFVTGLLTGGASLTNLDTYFCHWKAVQGGTLLDYDLGRYPFANQTVAANALVANPLHVPMLMHAPINENTGAMTKLITLSALQSVLQAHAGLGGTFAVATPALIYTNCVLRSVRDVTGSNENNPQTSWLWEFEKPLISASDAESVVNTLMSKIDSGAKVTTSTWTNISNAVGNTSLGSSVTGIISSITGLPGSVAGML